MAASKGPVTVPTDASVDDFLAAVPDPRRRADGQRLHVIFGEVTGEKAVMWGPSIVGFGSRHYTYESGREGDWPPVGFSPRAAQLVLYLMCGLEALAPQLERLGPHKLGKGCLYIKRLDAIDEGVLREMIALGLR